jgi:hypothetical protein
MICVVIVGWSVAASFELGLTRANPYRESDQQAVATRPSEE